LTADISPATFEIVQFAELLAERWFFFAQARHPQNLYYEVVSRYPSAFAP